MPRVVVVLVETEGSTNLGSVARLCGNFGATLRLVRIAHEVLDSEAFRMAHPCQALLDSAQRYSHLEDALADVALSVATSSKIASALDGPPLDLERAKLLLPLEEERLAFVFGNERTGLSRSDVAKCHRVYRLHTPGPVESFNLASAVASSLTLLFEAARTDRGERRASCDARTAMLSAWRDALDASGFYTRTSREGFEPRLEELIAKMDLSPRDTTLMQQMFTLFALAGRRGDLH
ncbi:MAG: hypothetical protein HY791_04085 [Deltaproteobacteria bacterium]|nr:hypothetical protein [Deltaproteobacteria bacterium]